MSVNTAVLSGFNESIGDGMSGRNQQLIMRDPRFIELVRRRNSLATVLSAVTLAIYLGFILLVAFDKPLLAMKVGGGATSLGIVLGLVVIVSAFILTAIYVVRANGRFDQLTDELTQEYGQ